MRGNYVPKRRYNELRQRRIAWRAEIDRPKRRYSLKTIHTAIRAITEEMATCLKEISP